MKSARLAPVALALISAFGLQPPAFLDAAPPSTAFTYQGRLQQSDTPANGSYDFVFRLYDASTNGSQIGPLVRTNAVPVIDGLFLVALDFGPGTFTGDDRWLQISVQTNGAARFNLLSPRQLLNPAPWAQFALKSASAESSTFAATAGGIAGSNLTASADGLLTLRAPSIAIESERFTNTVAGSASQVIGANSEEVVSGHLSITAGLTYHLTAGSDVTESFGRHRATEVSSDYLLTVGGAHALSIGKGLALEVGGDLTATCAQSAWIQAGTLLTLEANDEVWLKTGASSMQMKKNGDITIKGKKISIKGSDEIAMKQGAAFRSVATETNETTIGIVGESAATNGIGVLGIATSTADDDVHVGVLAVADAGNKRLALLANCVTNDLLPATAIPRPAAIAGRALANQDILQGYGKNYALNFRVSDGGVVTATAFEGEGTGLTGIGAEALADNSVNTAKIVDGSVANADLADNAVTSAKIIDGTLVAADLSVALASNTFWRLGGNSGTTPGTHFLGTTDNRPLELRANGTRALRLESSSLTNGAPNLIGGSPHNAADAGVLGAFIGGGGATNYYGSFYTNRVSGDFGAVVGGANNAIQSSASYAFIGGGRNHSIQPLAHNSTVGGGNGNTIWRGASSATIAGGNANAIQTNSTSGTVGGGFRNLIGTNCTSATIGGGNNNTITNAAYATVPGGRDAVASHYGQLAHASGRFYTYGDAQASLYVLRVSSSGTSAYTLALDGDTGTQLLTMPTGARWAFDILVIGSQPGGASASFQIKGAIRNTAGAVAFVGTPAVTSLGTDAGAATWTAAAQANDTTDSLDIVVHGSGAAWTSWVANVRTVEVTPH